ncbi:MAG TPA: ABC transporter ATP-binding protein [Candidatus Limnocylindria bacterium]|nr:ABC transporter ATP-binding protein [Candidatus Limnocylindria bacterium]
MEETPARVADVAVRLVQLTKRFGGDATGRRVAGYVEDADADEGFLAVDHIDLDVNEGEFFSLLGPSGCGKTTTLRMIGGFEQPTNGRIELQGEDVTWLPAYKRNVNTVFQNYALFPHLTIFENVAFGLRRKKVGNAEVKQRVTDMLELVELPGYERRKPGQISGGQAQRVALARALVNKPAVLLLDEPLGALDLKLRKQMQVELKRIQQGVGITFIYVTHDQEEAMTMSDRIAVMHKGKYEQLGDPEALYERPQTRFVAGFLGVSNLLPATRDGMDGDYATFRLGDGTAIRVPAALVEGRGSKVAIGIRPEKFRMIETTKDVPAGLNRVPGVVSHASYLGVSTQYIVTLADGHRITVFEQNVERATKAELWTSGEQVVLAWSPDHCFVVEEGDDAESDPADLSQLELVAS